MILKIGDYEVELVSARTATGWEAEGVLPDGQRVRSGPCKSQEDAQDDVRRQASARLYTQRRYDVNRPFESHSAVRLSAVSKAVVKYQADQLIESVP